MIKSLNPLPFSDHSFQPKRLNRFQSFPRSSRNLRKTRNHKIHFQPVQRELVNPCNDWFIKDIFGKATIANSLGTVLPATAQGNRFMFTGREFLKEVGLYDYRNRVYSQELGRFLQTDPIRFLGEDINLYRYAGNSVTLFIDPSGLKICVKKKDKKKWDDAKKKLKRNKKYRDIINRLENSSESYDLNFNNNHNDSFNPNKNEINWDPNSSLNYNGKDQSPENGLGHELDHADRWDRDPQGYKNDTKNDPNNPYNNKEEQRVIEGSEKSYSKQFNEPVRTDHTNGTVHH